MFTLVCSFSFIALYKNVVLQTPPGNAVVLTELGGGVLFENKNSLLFLLGNHDGRTAKRLIESIDKAVTEKVSEIINNSPFMSLLTDGSQARKTGDDKEMMLTRIEKNGNTRLQNISQYLSQYVLQAIILHSIFRSTYVFNDIFAPDVRIWGNWCTGY